MRAQDLWTVSQKISYFVDANDKLNVYTGKCT